MCSNSLRSDQLENAVGLLKEELRRCGSLIMECADAHRVEAGGALAVDRHAFSAAITEKIRNHPNITVVEGEVTDLPAEGNVIVATGPLTSLHFFDAAAPLVTFESVDMDSAWFASRYDRGTPDYINCPLTQEEYQAFWEALTTAQEAEVHGFEDAGVFEGCMPVEVMARRGRDTLCYGPLKPVGLKDPKTGKEPFAVVQLRKDNAQGSIYNIVGFQTHLKSCTGTPFWTPPGCWTGTTGCAPSPASASPDRSPGWRAMWSPPPPAVWRPWSWPGSFWGSPPSIFPRRPPWARWLFTSAMVLWYTFNR